jgi:hypothetical protein
VSGRPLAIALGLLGLAGGAYLVMSPLVVAALLDRPHATTSQLINLRASWGGVVVGIGAFLLWRRGPWSWSRAALGALLWVMAGVGVARLVGFALDGRPDQRQLVWITAEAALVGACAWGLGRRRAVDGKRCVPPQA